MAQHNDQTMDGTTQWSNHGYVSIISGKCLIKINQGHRSPKKISDGNYVTFWKLIRSNQKLYQDSITNHKEADYVSQVSHIYAILADQGRINAAEIVHHTCESATDFYEAIISSIITLPTPGIPSGHLGSLFGGSGYSALVKLVARWLQIVIIHVPVWPFPEYLLQGEKRLSHSSLMLWFLVLYITLLVYYVFLCFQGRVCHGYPSILSACTNLSVLNHD